MPDTQSKYCYNYPRPSVTVDIIVENRYNNSKHILLIKRKNNPFKNSWALPGGFVDKDEALLDAAIRELEEETGICNVNLKQFHTFGNPGRDPRGHCVSIVYYTKIENRDIRMQAGDDAKDAKWFDINKLPTLAFDHSEIITLYLNQF
jgi:8-oxo-dGTP diphosphatase